MLERAGHRFGVAGLLRIEPDRRADAANYRANGVAVALRVTEPFEDQNADPFAGNDAVGLVREGGMRAPFRQDFPQLEAFIDVDVHAALPGGAQHHVDRAIQEHPDRRADRRQRRDVMRVDRKRPPHQVERLRES